MNAETTLEQRSEVPHPPVADIIAQMEASISQLQESVEILRRQYPAKAEPTSERTPAGNSAAVPLSQYGITPEQGAELSASFASFFEDWNAPGMELYDDYDANLAKLKERLAHEAEQNRK